MRQISCFIFLLFFSNNLFPQQSQILVPTAYDSIVSLGSGQSIQYIDGKVIKYNYISTSSPSILRLYKNGEHSFFDLSREVLVEGFEDVVFMGFKNGVGIIRDGDAFFYVDSLGNKLLSKSFDQVYLFSKWGMGIAQKGKNSYLIDKKGEVVLKSRDGVFVSLAENFAVLKKEGEGYFVKTFDGEALIPFPLVKMDKVGNGYLGTTGDGSLGVIDPSNEWRDFSGYKTIKPLTKSVLYFEKKNGDKGFMSNEYKILTTFDSYQKAENGLYYLEKNRKYAIADTTGIPQTGYFYESLKPFGKNSLLSMATQGVKRALINQRGEALSGFIWRFIWPLKNKYTQAYTDYYNKNILDFTGVPIFDLQTGFISVGAINDSLFKAKDSQYRHGIVDREKNVIIPFIYDDIEQFHNGVARAVKEVAINGKTKREYGYLSLDGDFLELNADDRKIFYKGYGIVTRDSIYAVVDSTLKIIIPFEKGFTEIKGPHQGLFRVKNNGLYGYFNTKGEKVVDFRFYAARRFKYGKALVNHTKFINRKGEFVEGNGYSRLIPLKNGLAAVRKNEKWGFIDQTGKLLTGIEYDDFEAFSDGFVLIKKNGKTGLVNKKGEVVAEPVYSQIQVIKQNEPYYLFMLKSEGKEEFLFVENGKVTHREIYDGIVAISLHDKIPTNYYRVEKNGRFGVVEILMPK